MGTSPVGPTIWASEQVYTNFHVGVCVHVQIASPTPLQQAFSWPHACTQAEVLAL